MVEWFMGLSPLMQALTLMFGVFAAPASVVGGLYRWAMRPRMIAAAQRDEQIERVLRSVEYHLKPNGHEDALSPDVRDQPVRTLVISLFQQMAVVKEALLDDIHWRTAHDQMHAQHGDQSPSIAGAAEERILRFFDKRGEQ